MYYVLETPWFIIHTLERMDLTKASSTPTICIYVALST